MIEHLHESFLNSAAAECGTDELWTVIVVEPNTNTFYF